MFASKEQSKEIILIFYEKQKESKIIYILLNRIKNINKKLLIQLN